MVILNTSLFQLLSEFILVAVASGIVIFEYKRSSEKEEVRQLEIEREKMEMRGKITNLEFTVAKQTVQIKELTRLTIAIRDDLQKIASNSSKKSGFFGGGNKDQPGQSPSLPASLQFDDDEVDIKPKNVTFDHELGPISKAVFELNLYAA